MKSVTFGLAEVIGSTVIGAFVGVDLGAKSAALAVVTYLLGLPLVVLCAAVKTD